MPMQLFLAAGLFDSPWMLVVIVIISVMANWLSKRREEKNPGQGQAPGTGRVPSTGEPAEELDLEEALRRLMGQPSSKPTPPPLPQAPPRSPPPPVPVWQEYDKVQTWQETIAANSRQVSGTKTGARATAAALATKEQLEQAARFRQITEGSHRTARKSVEPDGTPSTGGIRPGLQWRRKGDARKAFVASLVFGPPKGLES